MNRRLNEIQARIENCTNEEINTVVGMIKNQRANLAMNARSKFTIGQQVVFSGMTGHIEKLAIKNAVVKVINGGSRYRVNMSGLVAA